MLYVFRVLASFGLLLLGMVIFLASYHTMAWLFTGSFDISEADKVACGVLGLILGVIMIIAAFWKKDD